MTPPAFPPADTVRTAATLESCTRGAAGAVVEAEQSPERTGTTDDEWWRADEPPSSTPA